MITTLMSTQRLRPRAAAGDRAGAAMLLNEALSRGRQREPGRVELG